MGNKYKTVWISDIHLGSYGCNARILCDFLKELKKEGVQTLYLVGDIIDIWAMSRTGVKNWKPAHTKVIELILELARKGTSVHYIIGNHDECFRGLIEKYAIIHAIDGVYVHNEATYRSVDGRDFLVIHGDQFDVVTRHHKWVARIGDWAYEKLLKMNRVVAYCREKCGLEYWSLSAYMKTKAKEAVKFINDYEDNVARYAEMKGFDGVICGHIHHPTIKELRGITYMNDGDFVESCSALVEYPNGKFEILYKK